MLAVGVESAGWAKSVTSVRLAKSKGVRIAVEVLGWGAVAAGALGIGLHFSRSDAQPLVLAASLAPYLMACALVGAVVFGVARRWAGAGIAVAVLGVALATQVPLFAGDPAGEGPEITVMQANLLFDGADPGVLVEQVRSRNVTLLTVNELTAPAIEALGRAGLDQLLPYKYVSPAKTAAGTGIWSAYPLTDTVEYDGYILNQLSATATLPGIGPVTVFALHPVPPVYGTDVWADELSRLRAILDAAPADRPVIAGGDLNATYNHAQYRAMVSGRYADAAEQAGAGYLRTYPTDKPWPPLVGIDHILLSGAHAAAVETVELPGADHRALVARIQLRPR